MTNHYNHLRRLKTNLQITDSASPGMEALGSVINTYILYIHVIYVTCTIDLHAYKHTQIHYE